jgi:hypothetical protein
MAQDTAALKNQMTRDNTQSPDAETELLGYLAADPLVASLDLSLAGAGFTHGDTEVIPVSNRSGSFLLTYTAGTKTAILRGTIRDSHVPFAEETSGVPVPLPGALTDNTTCREYGNRMAGAGFTLNQTRINLTPDRETVELTYANPNNRILLMKAVLQNGTVISVIGDDPDDPFAGVVPLIGLFCILLISAGIWYLARIRPADRAAPTDTVREPDPPVSPRQIAAHLLDEAERDAARGIWPEAYRKTGRAIRIVLSHEIRQGDELTNSEVEHLIGCCPGDPVKIRGVLDRCQTVGFAKDPPRPGEFADMVGFARALLDEDS